MSKPTRRTHWLPTATYRGRRGSKTPSGPSSVASDLPSTDELRSELSRLEEEAQKVQPWTDVEVRLLGFLRGRLYGAKRTPATPQSLNLQGLNWCVKNHDHLGEYQHPAAQAALVARCVNVVLPPSLEEAGLIDVYQREGEKIKAFNNGLDEMGDRREDLRWLVGLGGVTAAVAGTVAGLTGSRVIGGGLLAAGIAGVGIYGWSKVRDITRRAQAARWY
ncbi:hypothetical protein 1 [Hubei tombus-like virus 12]|uniref:hypothetical protein 1 n=1 Tax=Hubei tombus-like virus 12 TaxID=1923258 RepID=UPI0009095115|nr:hypothetical protein 1 [Hubei tombus-like virus 12]APG76519.1 hypothetical protein 1 [Hubei tombus-like virus 12]